MHYFIINPNSRSGAGKAIWNSLRSELALRRIMYKAYITEYVGHAVKLAAEISSKGTPEDPVYLIAMGGDGTINEVLTGINDFDNVIFGFIPTGSGNDFCRGMRLPTEPAEALDVILKKEHIRLMDVPQVTIGSRSSRIGVSTGIGFDAAICQEAQVSHAKKILNRIGLGKLVYAVIALKQIICITPAPMTFSLDGGRKRTYQKVFFASVMNQPYEGGGFKFCPNAENNDGVLDVFVVEGIRKPLMVLCLAAALFGGPTHLKGIHVLRCKSIDITSAVPLPIHKDGESGGIQSELSVSLEKKALKVIAPVL